MVVDKRMIETYALLFGVTLRPSVTATNADAEGPGGGVGGASGSAAQDTGELVAAALARGEGEHEPVRGGRSQAQGALRERDASCIRIGNSVVEARAESCPHCGTGVGLGRSRRRKRCTSASSCRRTWSMRSSHVTRVKLHGCDCTGHAGGG